MMLMTLSILENTQIIKEAFVFRQFRSWASHFLIWNSLPLEWSMIHSFSWIPVIFNHRKLKWICFSTMPAHMPGFFKKRSSPFFLSISKTIKKKLNIYNWYILETPFLLHETGTSSTAQTTIYKIKD